MIPEEHAQSGVIYHFNKPNICPHCGTSIDAGLQFFRVTKELYLVLYKCTFSTCRKGFYALYSLVNEKTTILYILEMKYMYPKVVPRELSKEICAFSPAFVAAYLEAFDTEAAGHSNLAACGYRNAMEVLIKDYAMEFLGVEANTLKEVSLSECIRKYLTSLEDIVSAQMVKDYANNTTHYPPDDEDYSFADFKAFYNIFLAEMESKIKIQLAKAALPPKLQAKADSAPK